MARLIDLDALGIGKCNPDVFNDKGYAKGWNSAIEILQNAPTVDAVPVRHGRWIDSEEDGHPTICGVCNYPVDRFYKTKYCPNCGAKMTEDHHEQKE